MKKFLVLLSAVFLSTAMAADGVMVMDPWIAEAPPMAKMNAGYMTVMNKTDNEVVLTGVSSDALGMIMMHETVIDDKGMSSMQHLQKVVIGAHQSVKFSPGGKHLMFTAPSKPLQAGDKVKMTLHFANGKSLDVEFTVRKQGSGMKGMDMDHGSM